MNFVCRDNDQRGANGAKAPARFSSPPPPYTLPLPLYAPILAYMRRRRSKPFLVCIRDLEPTEFFQSVRAPTKTPSYPEPHRVSWGPRSRANGVPLETMWSRLGLIDTPISRIPSCVCDRMAHELERKGALPIFLFKTLCTIKVDAASYH